MYQRDQGGVLVDGRVMTWQKSQEIRAGKVTLRDRCFELSDQQLQANQGVQGSVQVGTVKHSLSVENNGKLELYDYPGAYAQRFDGVGPNGEDQASQLQNIYTDGTRTANIRMQQETAEAVRVDGESTCQQLNAGCKFSLENHYNADGKYVLTQVEHDASLEGAFTESYGRESTFRYRNHFQAIPLELPYRPAQVTPKPRISGVQTALVVGHGDNQLYCDKYGRVKVQFYWDRQGNNTPASSCWIRVAQVWAGKGWGAMFFPRVGHEVVVAFEEGDIDQPLIVGSVYNSETVPHLIYQRMLRWVGSNHAASAANRERSSTASSLTIPPGWKISRSTVRMMLFSTPRPTSNLTCKRTIISALPATCFSGWEVCPPRAAAAAELVRRRQVPGLAAGVLIRVERTGRRRPGQRPMRMSSSPPILPPSIMDSTCA